MEEILLDGAPQLAAVAGKLEVAELRAARAADLVAGDGALEGHVDLSERRADSIKKYLVDKYGINGADLVTVGYGKSKLKDPGHPLAEANRRVQVVNMENKATAAK